MMPAGTSERFPAALKGLMAERGLSFRQLGYMTKLSHGNLCHLAGGSRSVPADAVIVTIAAALHVDPAYFAEYRLRQIVEVLDEDRRLIDVMYGILLCGNNGGAS